MNRATILANDYAIDGKGVAVHASVYSDAVVFYCVTSEATQYRLAAAIQRWHRENRKPIPVLEVGRSGDGNFGAIILKAQWITTSLTTHYGRLEMSGIAPLLNYISTDLYLEYTDHRENDIYHIDQLVEHVVKQS